MRRSKETLTDKFGLPCTFEEFNRERSDDARSGTTLLDGETGEDGRFVRHSPAMTIANALGQIANSFGDIQFDPLDRGYDIAHRLEQVALATTDAGRDIRAGLEAVAAAIRCNEPAKRRRASKRA